MPRGLFFQDRKVRWREWMDMRTPSRRVLVFPTVREMWLYGREIR